jgi:hypothetical protein
MKFGIIAAVLIALGVLLWLVHPPFAENLLAVYIPNFNLKRNIFIRSITPHGVSDSLNICEVYC